MQNKKNTKKGNDLMEEKTTSTISKSCGATSMQNNTKKEMM